MASEVACKCKGALCIWAGAIVQKTPINTKKVKHNHLTDRLTNTASYRAGQQPSRWISASVSDSHE